MKLLYKNSTFISLLKSVAQKLNSQHPDKKEQEVKNVVEHPVERGNHSIQSLQNFIVVHKSSISFNTSQISSIHAIATVLSTKEPEHLLSIGYEHLSITPKTESDKVTESNAKNLLLIPSKCEVALEDKKELENVVQQEEEEVALEGISQIQDVVLREKLLSITRLISNIESFNDNSTIDRVFNSFESNNSLLDNFSPEFKTFCDHTKETRSEEVDLFLSDNSIPRGIENVADDPEGDIRFLEELLIDDYILSHESFDSNFEDNLSNPRPPPKPPDDETDAEEKIPVVMNEKDEDVDYSSFIFVIYPEMFLLLLSAESEDTIFDPGISD
nr:hypothetical protein [Tanacetum cinerariifolium]